MKNIIERVVVYCEIIIFRGGSIFVVFKDAINNEFTSPTNNDVLNKDWSNVYKDRNIQESI